MARRGFFQRVMQRSEPAAPVLRPSRAIFARWNQVADISATPPARPLAQPAAPEPLQPQRPIPETEQQPIEAGPITIERKAQAQVSAPPAAPSDRAPDRRSPDPTRSLQPPQPAQHEAARPTPKDDAPKEPVVRRLTPAARRFLSEPAAEPSGTPATPLTPARPAEMRSARPGEPARPQSLDRPLPQSRPLQPQAAKPVLPEPAPAKSSSIEPKPAPAVVFAPAKKQSRSEALVPRIAPPPAHVERAKPTIEIGSIEVKIVQDSKQPPAPPQPQPVAAQPAPAGRAQSLSRGWMSTHGWRQG